MIIGVTGHRPEKLGGYGHPAMGRLTRFADAMIATLRPSEVVTGMALGWDQAIALACVSAGIPFTAAVPFHGQDAQWPDISRRLYRHLMTKAADIRVISPGGFSKVKMMRRNEWIAEGCGLLLALHDGSPGGTSHCVRYATRRGGTVINVWPLWETFE